MADVKLGFGSDTNFQQFQQDVERAGLWDEVDWAEESVDPGAVEVLEIARRYGAVIGDEDEDAED